MTDGYKKLDYRASSEDKTPRRIYKKIRKDRFMYGVSVTDTWGLDYYLSIVLGNSLKMLADNAHAFPGVDIYAGDEGYDKWVADLSYHAEGFRMYAELGQNEMADHDNYDWPKDDLDVFTVDENGYGFFNPSPEWSAACDAWNATSEKRRVEARARVDEAFDWMKEWWEALWD
jgi:hypothetical protein